MSTTALLFARDGYPYPSTLLHEKEEWGLRSIDVVNPTRRFFADLDVNVPVVEPGIDAARLSPLPTPAQLLTSLPPDDNWSAQSKRSVGRLQAHFLICEDPQRRMDAREVETLAHQVSLVRHIQEAEHLRRVLIADEVGLGKTVEVGLLIKELLEQRPGLRVLYLAPARLVGNVRREFERLRLHFRQWTAVDSDATLKDPKIIASIHRAVHGGNFEKVVKTTPWDVLVVDECHHLSAWSLGGGDPREAFKLVRDLIAKQSPDGRVIFLSGTPHQGHVTRFQNLLELLRHKDEPTEALGGRVIYRTKEDIRDWDGHPLFPPRQVNDPLVVDLGPRYRTWVENIHHFYKPPKESRGTAEAKVRAAGWRCAQALQWAASSPQAGLGYLVRQAVRAKWDLKNATLREAIAALRPYRLGPGDEPVDQLYERIVQEVARQTADANVEDIEEDGDTAAASKAVMQGLERLLAEGVAIVREAPEEKWDLIKSRLLDPAGTEKVVLFAQPIETVTALARYVERKTGKRPALIVGGQSDADRQQQVDSFRNPDGPQFLVSSRAGGEGINLQVARRLIHIDVPWNPMELEQRVGRVHRFGSRQTILVDTVVVKDSREADAYRIARQKLHVIASTLVEKDRFDTVFSRVMCLVPPEELQDVLLGNAQAPFSSEDQEKLARMVQRGFASWREFHDRFGEQQRQIRQQDPGLVAWGDVETFVKEHLGAGTADGFRTQRFRAVGGRVNPVEEEAHVVRLPNGQVFVCGEPGAPVFGPDGQMPSQLGVNIGPVAEALRRLAFAETPTGAAHLRWPADVPKMFPLPVGILAFIRQTVRPDLNGSWLEQSNTLHCYLIRAGVGAEQVEGDEKAKLLRAVFGATVRTRPELDTAILGSLASEESRLAEELRRPSEREYRQGIRHAVTPAFASTLAE